MGFFLSASLTTVSIPNLHTENGAKNPSKTVENLANSKGTANDAKFTFAGLDAGTYKLEETTTPSGYNTIDPIEFIITATHELVSDSPTLTLLTGTGENEFTMSSDLTNGELSKDIENNQGAVLPSTGGMGTTIFYIIGVVLLAGAAIILVTKRRMNAE